ncbi:MAG: 1-deoxy-D-xylulose-5-phosphate reductoisomerase [Chloroflexi bacterium]|nr:1-deoxy-D-xylulose-5-phosphate reductoisomerase [Chloroflexota bacterium]MBV9546823.1 1-deoxy-D-xylulose-5-phosphate reductoisomerase [Chloroflexota bacterium]
MKSIAVLGSTGSIGRQTLDVVRWHPDEFRVVALVAGRPSEVFEAQVREFGPPLMCLTSSDGADQLVDIACDPRVDMLVVATSGTVGFAPTIAALEQGKPVALANKETLIMAGHLVRAAAARSGAALLPIDSEHSAIWQCLQGEEPYAERIRRLLLTASGGAFRDRSVASLADVTPAEALKHPTWTMGPKITVDSATLMNKGLEVIEAHWLFDLTFDRIDVVIHHQSVIHSLVEFVDGSVKGQLGVPDMRLPIQYALAHPRRLQAFAERLDLTAIGQLTFAAVDAAKYPCLGLAFAAGRAGGTAPTVLNAANEEAVARFLAHDLAFLDIARVIDAALSAHLPVAEPSLEQVLVADNWARAFAREWRP